MMNAIDVTVISRVDGTVKPAKLLACSNCPHHLFKIFVLASGHQHLQCAACDESYCDGTCAAPQVPDGHHWFA